MQGIALFRWAFLPAGRWDFSPQMNREFRDGPETGEGII